MKKLSIIVPHHSENLQQIERLLNSINAQAGIDFNDIEIILCKDVDETPIDNCDFSQYTNIKDHIKKLKSDYAQNPGMSRQKGIDNCDGEYVFFCDADDCLSSVLVLRELFENIEKTHADVYRFTFIEEIGSFDDEKLFQYQVKGFNWVWVFAKAYKKEWLTKNNIRFNPTIRWHEDTYFNMLCKWCEPNTIDIKSCAYLWCFSRTSVTRVGNHEYTFNSIDEYLDAVGKAFDVIYNQYKKNCGTEVLSAVNTYYKTLMDPDNRSKDKYEYIEKCFYDFLCKYAKNLFDGIPIDIQRFFAGLRWSGDNKFLPELSLSSYLKYLREKYEITN